MARRNKKYQPKLTKEEYENLTGQRLGSLKNQGNSNITQDTNQRQEIETSSNNEISQGVSNINNTNQPREINNTNG